MTADDLDRILASEEPLVPSSGFAAATMERVRESAAAPPPLPFPWRRFLLGLLVTLALSGLGGWTAAGSTRWRRWGRVQQRVRRARRSAPGAPARRSRRCARSARTCWSG